MRSGIWPPKAFTDPEIAHEKGGSRFGAAFFHAAKARGAHSQYVSYTVKNNMSSAAPMDPSP